jgi:uncharacterized protein (DUF302 family)
MANRQITVERFSVTSSRTFGEVTTAFDAALGHPDMTGFRENVTDAKSYTELETVVRGAVGSSGLMEFIRLDLGDVLRKELGAKAPQSLRYLVGNPLIMKRMVERVPDAGSYAPVTILIDERPDGVHLSYDRMESFLAPYGDPEAQNVARDLDAKIEALLTAAAC